MKKEIVYTDIQIDEGILDTITSKIGGLFRGAKAKSPQSQTGTSAQTDKPKVSLNGKTYIKGNTVGWYEEGATNPQQSAKQIKANPQLLKAIEDAYAKQSKSTQQGTAQQGDDKTQSGQSAATTASKQAAGTSAAKGGGRVQPRAGFVDVRRATYGKMMLALQAAGITDEKQQKQFAEQIITNVIIPYLTVHLNARGINITDLRSRKSSLSQNAQKDQSGKPRVVTLSEQSLLEKAANTPKRRQGTILNFIANARTREDILKIEEDFLRTVKTPTNYTNPEEIKQALEAKKKELGINNTTEPTAKSDDKSSEQSQANPSAPPPEIVPSSPEAQNIVKTKIDPTKPIPLFTGSASLLQRINSSIKSRAKIDINKPEVQDQFKQIIKDLVDQLKVNGITNKQIQENFDYSINILSESQINRWKVLAEIKK